MNQLDLFTNEDVFNAINIYKRIEQKLSKYNLSEHINLLPEHPTLTQNQIHLEKHKNYEHYLKEMNELVKKELIECKDTKDLFDAYVPCYYQCEDKKHLIVKYKREGYWIQRPLYHFGNVSSELFRKILQED